MRITLVRNTAQTLTFSNEGDYSGSTVKFTVKADKGLTSSRLIDKDVTVSYGAPTSTFTVSLLPADTAGLSLDGYYFDLRVENSTTDKAVIASGIAYLNKSVRNPTDGLTTELTEFTVTEIDPYSVIPLAHRATGYAPIQNISIVGFTGDMSVAFSEGVITYTHSLGQTNTAIKALNDTYTYTIATENETTLEIEVRDSEGELISALTSDVDYLMCVYIQAD